MSEITKLEHKYKLILKGFLHENYKNKNDLYFEKLFSHLSGKNGQGTDYKPLLHSTVTIEWIDECLQISTIDFGKLDEKVLTFMLKLTALLTENEWLILQLRERKLADRIEQFIRSNLSKLTPSIKLGYIYFLSAISKYSIGISWIKATNVWTVLLNFCKENDTIYVKRQATALLFEIFVKFSTKIKDEQICEAIINEITKPINENIFTDQTLSVRVDDTELQKLVSPSLDLMLYFIQNSLENQTRVNIAAYFEPCFETDKLLWKYIDTFHNQYFVGKLLKILTALNYARLVLHKSNNGKISEEDFTQFGVNFYNYMKFCLMRRSCENVLVLAEYNKILWTKLGSEVPDEIIIENEKINFETQLATIQLMPVLIFLKPSYEEMCKEIIDNYIIKIFNITNEFTQRIAYAIRDLLLDCPQNAIDLSCKAINGILSMKNFLNQAQAVLIFQAMTYALKSFLGDEPVPNGSTKRNNLHVIFREDSNVMFSLVVGLHSIVEHFKITWKDSIETTCLLTIVLELLGNSDLTSRVAVQLLKLAQLSIERFLSPNMALLMNNFNESGMQNLEPMMLKRLHDNSWEVRDSTLELITTVVSISEMKFPPFQQFILDSGVCPIVFSMAQNDSEPYIRASALKCLAEMIKINLIWDKSLSQMNLMKFVLSFIPKESEGIVRKEAVILVTKLFENRKYTTTEPNKLFSVMAYSAVNDFYWEVKVNALQFWKAVICQQFTNQGMIDGTFPTVTFSKQHKKIVTLTDKEILLRIRRILEDLCKYGILGILLECLQDECDFEVVKVTVSLLQRVLDCLHKYDFIKTIVLEKNPSNEEQIQNSSYLEPMESDGIDFQEISNNENGMDTTDLNLNENIDSDSIIESILNSTDLNLLAYGYQNNNMNADAVSVENNEVIDDNFYKKFTNVTPDIFLSKITKMNLDSLIEVKQNWISDNENFESLLDDMVFSIKTLGVNDADCY